MPKASNHTNLIPKWLVLCIIFITPYISGRKHNIFFIATLSSLSFAD